MGRMKQTEIYSIFGQIEAVVADAMIREGKANKIEQADIPLTALFNERDERARFAIVIGSKMVPEFERRIAALYT